MTQFLLRKFPLGHKNYLSLGLQGKQVEIRVTCFGKTSLNLSLSDLHVLQNQGSLLMQSSVTFSTSVNDFDEIVCRSCVPDGTHVRFVRETSSQAQPLNPEDNLREEFKFELVCMQAFVRFLPNLITIGELILSHEEAITLAYTVIQSQIRRLCDANGYHPTYEHFLFIMRLLQQYVPLSFLVSDFKKNFAKGEVALNLYELFKTVLLQFEYIYENLYIQ